MCLLFSYFHRDQNNKGAALTFFVLKINEALTGKWSRDVSEVLET